MADQEKTEEQLHFLQALIDASRHPSITRTWTGSSRDVNNKAFANVFGLAKEDIIGKTSYDISPKNWPIVIIRWT